MAGESRVSAAIVYDFDGTLAEGNIQEHSLIPSLGVDVADFWSVVREKAREHDADEVLIYMWWLLEVASTEGVQIRSRDLQSHGREVPLFPGVEGWFPRINRFAEDRNLDLRHFVISSGLFEMIEGCPIFKCFERVFASRYIYDKDGIAIWPGLAINYTTKTQYLFRINKGIGNSWDNEAINRWVPRTERPIPFSRMIFLGDGDTDIPTMKMMHHQGGHSVAVFDERKWKQASAQDKIGRLIAEERVRFVAPANYTEDSQLDVTVKGILGRIAREEAGFR
jgi:hypothetical protein